jgi:hypothetical protein
MTTGRQHMMVWFAAGTGAAAIERHQILLSQVPAPGQLRRPGGGTGAEHLDRSGAGRQHPGGDAKQGRLVGALRVLWCLTRGNRQPCHPVSDRRVALAASASPCRYAQIASARYGQPAYQVR